MSIRLFIFHGLPWSQPSCLPGESTRCTFRHEMRESGLVHEVGATVPKVHELPDYDAPWVKLFLERGTKCGEIVQQECDACKKARRARTEPFIHTQSRWRRSVTPFQQIILTKCRSITSCWCAHGDLQNATAGILHGASRMTFRCSVTVVSTWHLTSPLLPVEGLPLPVTETIDRSMKSYHGGRGKFYGRTIHQ